MEHDLHIAELLSKKIKGEITSEGEKELQKWLSEDKINTALYNKVLSSEVLLDKLEVYELFDKTKVWASLENKLFATRVIKLNTNRWLRYAASILLPLVMLTGVVYYLLDPFNTDSLARIDEKIRPGEQKATLVLSDGAIVDLQSEETKTTLKQGKTVITNQNSSLTYVAEELAPLEEEAIASLPLLYNELITPRGGSYTVTLPDGTDVWLNAATTLKYPVAFTDSTRQVFLEGEALFDVAHNGKPFIVSSGETDVRVLGTTFNVNAYPEEMDYITTLVEGSVRLSTSYAEKILVPGEQALIAKTDGLIITKNVNTALYTSWIAGKIEFTNDDLDGVMRRLSRWYDFDYSFENEQAKNFHFSARIDNTQKISDILKMMEMTTQVKFDLNGKTIVIL